ncbi:MAG: GTPase [Nanoarchaeota archaeon]
MASTNQSPQYKKAESLFLSVKTDKDRLFYLEEMIRECPKHKSSEKMLAQLKTRRKKLLKKIEVGNKKGKTTKQGIKKEEMQAVIVGFTNTGRSELLSMLTNARPEIAQHEFTTKQPIVGMMGFQGTGIQIIEIPAFGSEYYDKGLVNSADVILVLVTELLQLEKLLWELSRTRAERIVVFNNKNGIDERKLEATLRSKKLNYIVINTETGKGLDELKEKIFLEFHKIRVFTKEPGKEKSDNPLILGPNATVKDVASKIFHDVSKVRETKIWGPSSKFPGQIVGLNHRLKDLDVVEFKTR